MRNWPTRPKAQTARLAKARQIAVVKRMVIASAASFGIRDCSHLWAGQTTPMMNRAAASGANTLFACDAAAQTSTAAMTSVATLRPKPTPSLDSIAYSARQFQINSNREANRAGHADRHTSYAICRHDDNSAGGRAPPGAGL